jgi:hypothetical protein
VGIPVGRVEKERPGNQPKCNRRQRQTDRLQNNNNNCSNSNNNNNAAEKEVRPSYEALKQSKFPAARQNQITYTELSRGYTISLLYYKKEFVIYLLHKFLFISPFFFNEFVHFERNVCFICSMKK